MRVFASCPHCVYESLKAGVKSPTHFLFGEIDDNGLIHTRCDRGHGGVVILDAPRYEILIESAARAFLDGYTNETVAVLATALERAYEFHLRVLFRAKGVTPELFAAGWKELANSSERQFGAFHMLHLFAEGELIPLDKRIPEIRNKVVHRGHIVREKEALEFAELVFSRIRSMEKELESKYKEASVAEAKYQVSQQQLLTAEKDDALVVKKMIVMVDPETNEVIGVPEKFIDVVRNAHESRGKGFSP